MSARSRSPTGSAPARVTSRTNWPARRTSSSTSSSRGRSGARPRPSPRSSTRWAGDCNAFTTKEYTTFYVRLLSEHLALGLDILSDIMWEPALRPADVEAERTVILDEILMHADEPADLASERWQAAAVPRPSARTRHARHGRRRCSASAATTSAPSSTCTTGRPTWSCRWPATAPTRRWPPSSSAVSPGPAAVPRRPRRRPGPTRCPSTWCAARPSRPTSSTACARCRASTSAAGRWPC